MDLRETESRSSMHGKSPVALAEFPLQYPLPKPTSAKAALHLLKSMRNLPNPCLWYWGMIMMQETLYFCWQSFSWERKTGETAENIAKAPLLPPPTPKSSNVTPEGNRSKSRLRSASESRTTQSRPNLERLRVLWN